MLQIEYQNIGGRTHEHLHSFAVCFEYDASDCGCSNRYCFRDFRAITTDIAAVERDGAAIETDGHE